MKPQGLQTNFENKANPGFASEEETYIMVNDKGIEVEVPKFVWNDHMRNKRYGWEYKGLKTEQGIKEVPQEEPKEEEFGQIGSDKPIKTIRPLKK